MNTILGSSGPAGKDLARELANYTDNIKLVSRKPKKVNQSDLLFPADLTDKEQLNLAVKGSEIVYVTIGFKYSTEVWQKTWIPFVKNLIDVCIRHDARLVFLDNIYAVGGDDVGHITEHSPFNPSSRKGEIRKEVDLLLLDAIEKRNLKAIIARSADFFGLTKKNSLLIELVYNNLAKGKKAQWLCDAKAVHSMSFVPDLAKGMAMLGNNQEAFGQIWNLPTSTERVTGERWIELFAKEMGVAYKYSVVSPRMIKFLGLFIPILKETYEMLYQYDRDYYFDSTKFNKAFNYSPLSSEVAVKMVVKQFAGK